VYIKITTIIFVYIKIFLYLVYYHKCFFFLIFNNYLEDCVRILFGRVSKLFNNLLTVLNKIVS